MERIIIERDLINPQNGFNLMTARGGEGGVRRAATR